MAEKKRTKADRIEAIWRHFPNRTIEKLFHLSNDDLDALSARLDEMQQTLATVEIAVIDLLGSIERDNTGDNSSPDDETWIGHCGVEIRALCRILDLDPGV
jgi:hypothetical protein